MIKLNELKTGTTTLGMICKDGVIVAADRKATMGNIIASKRVKKIYEISNNMYLTVAGIVGDAQALVRLLRAEVKLYELQERELTVKAAATLLANILRSSYKGSFRPDIVQLVLAGYDSTGPKLFSLGMDGSVIEEKEYTFTGSGSVIAVGVLEDGYKDEMSIDDGKKLLKRAIRAATERDVFSGGIGIDIVVIQKNKSVWLSDEEITNLLK